jgi:Uncharacterised nucleotidyltransferase
MATVVIARPSVPDLEPVHSLPPLPARFRLTPEFRLLLACTWVAPEECGALGITRPITYAQIQAEQISAACGQGIDWDLFLSLVDRHRVLVPHDELRRLIGDRLPDRAYEKLKSRSAKVSQLALRQTAELVRIGQAFALQGVEVIPLKGVLLSVQLFDDPAMRSTRDLDLLVRAEDLDEADQILKGEGYGSADLDFELTPKRKEWLLRERYHFGYIRDIRSDLVELHWCLPQWKAEDVNELWQHCQARTCMGIKFLTLKDDALLLFLCDHGSRHLWRRIKWLADVAALLAQERSFAWDDVLALADRFDLSRSLAEAGLLVHWLYGIRLPEPLVNLIARQKSAGKLARQSLDAMLMSERAQFALSVRLKNAVFLGRSRERLPLGMSWRSCLLSTDEFKEFPLPDSLFWLYFPLRPLLWFYHHYVRRKTR